MFMKIKTVILETFHVAMKYECALRLFSATSVDISIKHCSVPGHHFINHSINSYANHLFNHIIKNF